jgi:hypothetical protein
MGYAQQDSVNVGEQAFTFTEAQLGEDENVTQSVSIISSGTNAYANEVGYRWSPMRFKYRAYNAKYNDIYINGNPVNDIERGDFRYSFVGGLNNQTRSMESALPFEPNNFSMTGLGGSNNYNFRPSAMPVGQRLSLAGGNRNYTLRGMYSYNSGLNDKGWAWSAGLTYRWADRGYVEGTFYNSLSYFLGVEKVFNDRHALSLVTWGNPTERGTQSASTDEMYWLANNYNYNPNWGYQDGKKRNARVVNDYAPAALLTWDFKIDDGMKLTTSLLGKYSMYSSTRLNYNNATNPAPDYYSLMPSYFYNVWNTAGSDGTIDSQASSDLAAWTSARDYLMASKANRQINWDRLYYSNKIASAQGADAMYYQQAYHDDQLALSLSSALHTDLTNNSTLNLGMNLSTNKGMHYQTMEDLLGATSFHNSNYYVIGTYAETAPQVFYDLNDGSTPKEVKEGDRFGYDYNVFVNRAQAWAGYDVNLNFMRLFVNGRIGGTSLQREGKMRNGLAPNNSYGKSGTARFLDGGGKAGMNINLGRGNTVSLGAGYEWKAPTASVAFSSPQINNDFVKDLTNEKIFSSEIGYQLQNSWLHANIQAYYTRLQDVTEYSMFYYDSNKSFSYVSLSGIAKHYYGVEAGLDFKLSSTFSINTLATISEAKYDNNANVRYMLSNDGKYYDDIVVNKNMREGGTPLSAYSIDLAYHSNGWFIDLIGNYYDRIYLYYTPVSRYYSNLPLLKDASGNTVMDENGNPMHDISKVPSQAKGKGGFMLDASVGKSIYIGKHQMSINLMLTNILNNRKLVTGGMEQNRQTYDDSGETIRTYTFLTNPKKFYVNGINGMLIVTYKL